MTTRFFERLAALCTRLPVSQVAEMAQLSWDTVARVDTAATRLLLGGDEPSLDGLRYIGVDEVSRTGGRVFFTIVSNLETGRVVYIGDGKGKAGLMPFVEKLSPRAKSCIRVTASDTGYLSLLQTNFPKARHILDRFHIVKAVNEALNDVRRRLFGGAPTEKDGRALKAKQWMLLSGRENLEHRYKLLLASLMKLNRPLYRAYLLKEELRDILHHPWTYLGSLEKNLVAWCTAAIRSRLPEMAEVARWLSPRLETVLDGFKQPLVDIGIVECNNLTIANLRREARGYRNPVYFKFKIFQRTYRSENPWAGIIL
jgi:transposase